MNNQAWYSKQLFAALVQGHSWSLNKLLKKATIEDINQQNENGETLLIFACRSNYKDVVKRLVAVPGIDVNTRCNDGNTALIWAARNNHTAIACMLLSVSGVNVNAQSNSGSTALLTASSNGHLEMLRLLLSISGIDASLQDETSKTALDYAETKGVKKLLRSLTFQPMTQRRSTAVSATTVAPDTTTATCNATAATPAIVAADAPNITSSTSVPEHSIWLAARLLHSGYGIDAVKECEKIIVIKEGFVQEGDWLECPPSEFNRAYLTSIGITGLGLQRHLVKLYSQLRPIYMKSVSPTWQEENSHDPVFVESIM